MLDRSIHPNTKILLQAWRRMSDDPSAHAAIGPRASEHADLTSNLFVLQPMDDGAWVFRTAGEGLSKRLGRDLSNHDFLHLWTGPDRAMMKGLMGAIRLDGSPGVIRGNGETLTGQRAEIEITLMPLDHAPGEKKALRFLGLYQTLGDASALKGRPIWRHRISMLVPPTQRNDEPKLKLVASNP